MRFEDQPASGDPLRPAPPSGRRRTTRSWSTPPSEQSRFGGPAGAPPAPSVPPPPRRRPANIPPPPQPSPEVAKLASLLGDLRTELSQLRGALETAASSGETAAVTGEELAATIEALGTALGGGMASLLTEHRNLLARDVESAADRILEELTQRLRTTSTQIVDAVEERLRHVQGKALGDLADQLDLRLDQIQSDVSGLRAVMLEIPDQTQTIERLDALSEAVGASGRGREANRVSPAMNAALERSVSGPLERLEATIEAAIGDSVREALDERLPDELGELLASAGGEGGLPGADALDALTKEMTALRRRISLRNESKGDAVELSDAQLDDLAARIAARMSGADGGGAEAPAPKRAGRRSR